MSDRGKVVTVFGGSGFIGRHLIRKLARGGGEVRIAVRRPSEAGFLKTAGDVGQIVPMAVDVRDEASITLAIAGANAAVNLIGMLCPTRRQSFSDIHVQAAGRIAQVAKTAGVRRFVHVSALGADPGSASAYARSKAQGEEAVRSAFPEATILRPGVVFGPEDRFLNRFAALARVSPALPLIGGGQTRFQPVYVADVAEAIAAALDRSDVAGRTFELGGPQVFTLQELMLLILRITGRSRLLLAVSWGMAERLGGLLELIEPGLPLLTRDQVELLRSDSVVAPNRPGLADLGLAAPAAIEAVASLYLARFARQGDFTATRSIPR